MDEAAKCVPPLENSELNTIWHSAQRFFSRIREQAGYVPPEAYNDPSSYKPEDYSDVGQAEVMARYFSGELRYSPATHFIRYSDHNWQESEPGAQAVAHELTRRQMELDEKYASVILRRYVDDTGNADGVSRAHLHRSFSVRPERNLS